MNRSLHIAIMLSVVGVFAQLHATAQCPEVLDDNGMATSVPTWNSCLSVGPELEIVPANDWVNVSVNWGDGSPVEVVNWVAGEAALTHVYPDGAGVYAIQLVEAASGCTVDGSFDVIPPVANLTAASASVCQGNSVNFQQTGSGGGQNYWNFGLGSTFIPTSNGVVSYLFNNPGNHTVTNIYVSDIDPIGCRDTSTVEILVKPKPAMEVVLSQYTGCGPTMITGEATGSELTNVIWSFAVAPYFASGFAMPSTYMTTIGSNPISVTGIGANGCNTPITQNVVLQAIPQASITSGANSVCAGEVASFNATASVPGGQSIVDITWDFGDGSTQSGLNAEHVYPEPGVFSASLTVSTSMCSNTLTEEIVVDTTPTVSLTASDLVGCAPFEVAFTGSVSNAATYALDLGEGGITTDLNAVHAFSASTHDITLSATSVNGCSNSTTVNVEGLAPATVNLVNVPEPTCGSVDFQLETVTTGATSLQWSATTGWTSNETMPQFALNNGNDYPLVETITVTAMAANGCNASAQANIELLPTPIYAFALTADTVCSPHTASLEVVGDAVDYHWEFGDGEFSNVISPFHVWENPTDGLAIFPVSFMGTNAYGCQGTVTRVVHVNPQPVANFSLSSNQGCNPLEVTFFNESSQATSYTLTTSAGQTVSLNAGEAVQLMFETETALANFDLELVASHALGCSDVRSESVEVYPTPVFEITTAFDPECTPYTVTFPAVDGAETATWDFGDGSETVNASSPTYTFENPTNNLVTYPVNMTGANAFGCESTASVNVPVKPMPVADFALSEGAGCAPFGVIVTNTSSMGSTYAFSADNGDAWFAETGESQTVTFIGGEAVETRNISLTVTHPLGCQDSRSETVTVFPEVQFEFSLDVDSACSPMTVTLPELIGADSWNWVFGDGSSAPGSVTEHTFSNPGMDLASFSVQANGQSIHGCTDSHEDFVHVKPQPVADFTLDATAGCSPFVVTATNASALGTSYTFTTDAGLTYDVNEAEGQTFTFSGSDILEVRDITLTAVHALGCSDASTQAIEVYPIAEFSFSLEVDSTCSPLEMTTPIIPNASQVNWRFDGGEIIEESTTMTWINSGMDLETHLVEMEAFNAYGCSDTHADLVHVKPQPVADFTLSDDAGCAPFPVVLTNTSTQADAFHWDYDDDHVMNTSLMGAHTYVFEGESNAIVRTIKLTASHQLGCSSEKTDTFEVYPSATAVATGTTSGCAPFDAAFAYDGPAVDAILWTLDGGTSTPGESFETTLTDGGFSTLNLEVTTEYGCTDDVNIAIAVFDAPTVELSIEESAACAGTPLLLTHQATGADNVTIAMSNGTVLGNPETVSEIIAFENPYANPITVVISQSATTNEGCFAMAQVEHTVYPDAEALFEAPASACAPFEAQLTNLSTDADSFTWNINGTTNNEIAPLHVFASAGEADAQHEIMLVATNAFGCADTLIQTVTAFGTPTPELSVIDLQGCYPIEATFEATGGVTAIWTHGDEDPIVGSDLVHSHVFFNPYDQPLDVLTTVEVANENGCSGTASVSVEINPELHAQFDAVEAGCSPLELVLVNQSSGASAFEWNFGDGATSVDQNPVHTLVNATPFDQTYVVQLIATSGYGCADTLAVGVEVHPEPVAEFFATPIEQVYPNTSVAFTNLSQSGNGAVHTWTFGDGGSTNDFAPGVHTYESWGTFDVTLDVDNGYCDHAVTQTVTIHPPMPTVAFSGTAEGCAPVDAAFTNESAYVAGVLWDFGDGATSTEFDPVHQYTVPGTYDVKLRVTGHQGLVQEVIHTGVVVVLPTPVALFDFEPYEVVAPAEEVAFVNMSSDDALEYLWNFGDGNTSTEQHPRHGYSEAGLYTVSLAVRNAYGCTDTHAFIDAILAKPGGFMEFPNAFTPDLAGPNGGGYQLSDLDNDVFHPHHAGIATYELSVFNIWGEMIFHSTDPMIGWDGYVNGLIAPQNTYVWKATAQFSDGRRQTQSGDFTLIIN